MPVTIGREYFLETDPERKLNCAQAVLKAFQEQLSIPEDMITGFKAYGGGRAPLSHCGAVFAADFVLGMAGIELESVNVVEFIESKAGSVKCEEIKSLGKLSCLECVEQSIAYVSDALKEEFN